MVPAPLVRELPLHGALTPAQKERAIDIMVRHERWPDLQVAEGELRRFAASSEDPSLVNLADMLYRRLLAGSGKARIGDKTPHYFAIIPELLALYPSAKFIHLMRDGRDVAMSWIDAGWERYYEPGFAWPRAVALLHRHPDHVLEVRYEDLVRNAEATVRRICDFLGEVFEPAMLDWQRRTGLIAERDRHLHARLTQPLSDDAIALWRRRLTGTECFAMEACLHRELRAAGYPLRFASRAWQPAFNVAAVVLRALAPLSRRAIPWLQRRGIMRRKSYM